MPASSAIASKLASPSGNRYVSTVAAAPENVECPDGYAGKFGSPITVLIDGSICVGRGLKYLYFVAQHATPASCIAMLSSANARAARTSLMFAFATYDVAIAFQCPDGVYVPAPSFHFCAIASCSRVRCVTTCFTSARSCLKRADDVDGGGATAASTAGLATH